jgi:hypothetical protein
MHDNLHIFVIMCSSEPCAEMFAREYKVPEKGPAHCSECDERATYAEKTEIKSCEWKKYVPEM